jgi:hypothetical protein
MTSTQFYMVYFGRTRGTLRPERNIAASGLLLRLCLSLPAHLHRFSPLFLPPRERYFSKPTIFFSYVRLSSVPSRLFSSSPVAGGTEPPVGIHHVMIRPPARRGDNSKSVPFFHVLALVILSSCVILSLPVIVLLL